MEQTTQPQPDNLVRRPYILNVPRAQIGKGFAKETKYSDRAFPVVLGGSYPPGTEFESPPGDPVRILPEQAWMEWGMQAANRHRATVEDLALADATSDELARRVVLWKIATIGAAMVAAAGWALLLAPVVLA